MSRLLRTRQACIDLQRLWIYVAERNFPAADSSSDPLAGESVEYLRLNTRRVTVGSYVVLFEPLPDGIRLLRVVHSSCRMEALFEDDN